MLCIVPSVGLALGNFEGAELRYAAGLFNLMRNLGGAIGIALVNTWLGDNMRWHILRLSEALGRGGEAAREAAANLTHGIGQYVSDPALAAQMANGLLGRIVGREALTLAFDDVFRLMSWIFLAALVMVPFCKPPPIGGPAPTDAH